MNLLALRYFCAAASRGKITLTADDLHVSQPAVSKMIHGLEAELGVSLFFRSTGGVQLTPAGKALYEKASEALELLDRGIREAKETVSSASQTLRLVTFLNLSFLPSLYLAFQNAHPDVRLELRHISPKDLLLQDRYDFAIIPEGYLTPQHRSVPLLKEEFLLAVSTNHPLAGRSSVDLSETAPYDFVVMGVNAPARQYFQALCQIAQFQPKIAVECDSTLTLIAFLEAGRGISLLPSRSAALKNDKLSVIPIRHPICSRTIHLCWPASQELRDTGLIFRDFCRRYVAQISAVPSLDESTDPGSARLGNT